MTQHICDLKAATVTQAQWRKKYSRELRIPQNSLPATARLDRDGWQRVEGTTPHRHAGHDPLVSV
jgi:hypothetical protein